MQDVTASVQEAIAEAGRHIRRRDHFAAVQLLRPLLDEAPTHFWLNLHLGRALSGLGDRPAATDRFLAAASSGFPEPVGAFYELVRLDLSHGDFGRVAMLDQALALPGELHCRFPATSHKRTYYSQIRFLQAMVALHQGEYALAEQRLEEAYAFSHVPGERSFGFDWFLDDLRTRPGLSAYPHLEYVRRIYLRHGMSESLDYGRLLDEIRQPASVLEIGAMDGVRFDPLYRRVVDNRWPAVMVEPIPDMFERLQANYQDCGWVRCANVAITETTGPVVISRIRPEVVQSGAQEWLLGISSLIDRPNLDYFAGAVVRQEVRGLTFGDLVEELGIEKIDILQIDTEGYDWRVLRQVDLDRWNIGLIHVEIVNLGPPDRLEVFKALESAGYRFSYDGMNVTAVRSSEPVAAGPGKARR